MRALAKCLLALTLLLGNPLTVRAQIEDPVGADVHDAFPGGLVQSNELIPPATEESAPLSTPADESMLVPDPIDEIPWGLAPGAEPAQTDPMQTDPLASGLLPGIPPDDVILDSGLGQPYDIPISDVMAEEIAEVFSTNDWFRGGKWYGQQEFVMLLRDQLPSTFIALDTTTAIEFSIDNPILTLTAGVYVTPVLHTKQTSFEYTPGTRLTWGKIFGRDTANRDHGIEFTFLGLFDYTSRSEIRPALPGRFLTVFPFIPKGIDTLLGSLEIDFAAGFGFQLGVGFPTIVPVAGFENARVQTIVHESDLNSFEVNYRIGGRPVRDRLVMQPDGRWLRFATPSKIEAMFAGFRYLRLHERFTYSSEGGIDQVTGLPIDERGFYRVSTDNNLVGFQLGGEATEKRTNWVFGLRGKAGGFVNFAGRKSRVDTLEDDDNNVVTPLVFSTRGQRLTAAQFTVLVETGAYASYYLRPNTSIRVGYDFLFMNGVTVASDNNNLSLRPEFPAFRVTQNAFYHGASIGFEKTW